MRTTLRRLRDNVATIMKRDARPALLVASEPLHDRANGPPRPPTSWLDRQGHQWLAWRHGARLKRLAKQLEAIAARAAHRKQLEQLEAEALAHVVSSLRVRAIHLKTYALAGLTDVGLPILRRLP